MNKRRQSYDSASVFAEHPLEGAAGKRTRSERLPVQRKAQPSSLELGAAVGTDEAAERLPFLDVMQKSLGRAGEPADTGAAPMPVAARPLQMKGWVGESMDRAKAHLESAEGVPEREHSPSGGVEVVAPGHFRIWGFPVDSAEPPKSVAEAIGGVARLYAGDPKSRVTIEGHTSASGSERHNEGLALLRAQRVMSLLLFRGLSPTRLELSSAGERASRSRGRQRAVDGAQPTCGSPLSRRVPGLRAAGRRRQGCRLTNDVG